MPLYLIHASGPDQPGIIDQLMQPLLAEKARVLDVGQAVIHQALSLGLLVELRNSGAAPPEETLKALGEAGKSVGIQVTTTSISPDQYEAWVQRQSDTRFAVTVLGQELEAGQLGRLSDIARRFGLTIASIQRLSGRRSLIADETPFACIELSVRGNPKDVPGLKEAIFNAAQQLSCDVAIQVDDMYRRNRRMIAFDMDSTLIQHEVIDELARAHGVMDQVSRITEAAMNGELDFDQSLRRRLGLLKGMKTDVMQSIAESLRLSPGAERLISTVNALGYKTAILSGGFTFFGQYLQDKLGIDHVFANELEIQDGRLTGEVVGPIVNGERKAELLQQLANQSGIALQQVIAVGDGANDLPMLNVAGLGIAFHAKPKVRASADQRICNAGLDGVLYMLGVRHHQIQSEH